MLCLSSERCNSLLLSHSAVSVGSYHPLRMPSRVNKQQSPCSPTTPCSLQCAKAEGEKKIKMKKKEKKDVNSWIL